MEFLLRKIFLAVFLTLFLLPSLAYSDLLDDAALQARADKGGADAEYDIAKEYQHGGKNAAEASKWFEKAAADYHKQAEHGDLHAQVALGEIYAAGWGVKQDTAEALKWYRMAVEKRDWNASLNLGRLYKDGTIVPQDYVEAYFLFSLSKIEIWEIGFYRSHRTNVMSIDREVVAAAEHLTPEQKGTMDKRVAEWQKTHPSPAAAEPMIAFPTLDGPPAPTTAAPTAPLSSRWPNAP